MAIEQNQPHPIAKSIEKISAAVGLKVTKQAANKQDVPLSPEEMRAAMKRLEEMGRGRDGDDPGGTCVSVFSSSVQLPGGRERTTIKVTLAGEEDHPDGTPGMRAPTFARLIAETIASTSPGTVIKKSVLNELGDREVSFTVEYPKGQPSPTELSLAKLAAKLEQDAGALKDFRDLNRKAQQIEEKFSDVASALTRRTPQFATRVTTTLALNDDGSLAPSMAIQTNHPQLKVQLRDGSVPGLSNKQVMSGFSFVNPHPKPGEFTAYVRGDTSRVYSDGQHII
ncbi:MAG: hypothetical protein K2Q01_00800, partial [Rickettsiales bacterium]|nr:hypothetical protein [Rickettsiales bacterium]